MLQYKWELMMKLPREVKIRIRPGGKVEIETEGFIGQSCADISDFFEKALEADKGDSGSIRREYRPEYYLNEQSQELENENRFE